jgi:hemerythrin-like metal-binding domain
MTRIEWSDEFKLGLPAIDAEHRELLDLCNRFLEAAQAGAEVPQLARILEELILRTRAHFLAEERLLDRHNYPGLAIHKAEHERLLNQADILKARYDDDGVQEDETRALTVETAEFLQSWLLDHIRANDRPYRPFIMTLS